MLGILPSSSSLLPGVTKVLSERGWRIERVSERACQGTLKGNYGEVHDVAFWRPDGAMQLVQTGYANFCFLGFDKLYESSGGVMPDNCSVYELPHISLKGQPTEVVLFSKKYSTLFPGARIASEYTAITERYCTSVEKSVRVSSVSGSAEVLVALGAADFGVAINETGTTLQHNGMHIVATLLTTSVVLVCKKDHTEANEFCRQVSNELCPAL